MHALFHVNMIIEKPTERKRVREVGREREREKAHVKGDQVVLCVCMCVQTKACD